MALPCEVETDCAMEGPRDIQMRMTKLHLNQEERFDSGIDSLRSVDSGYCLSVDRETTLPSINENSSLPQHMDSLKRERTDVEESRTKFKTQERVEDEDEAFVDCEATGAAEPAIEYRRYVGEHLTDDAFNQDQEGDTPLHLTIIHNEKEIALRFISYAEDPELLNISNYLMQTPLHLSVITKQPELCRALVLNNAQLDCIDRNGDTPLHIACKLDDDSCIRALTEGISPLERARGLVSKNGAQQLPQNLELRNFEGFTCVHIAGFVGNIDTLGYLGLLGANIDAPDGKSGRTALHNAVEASNFEIAHTLITLLGANVDALTFDLCTPLHLAIGRGLKAIMMLLMNNKADLNILNFEGERPRDLSRDSESMLYINSQPGDMMYTDIKIQGQ